MDGREMERILKGLVREGIVTDIDRKRRMVRVKFQSEDMTSGWLYVLQHIGMEMKIAPDGGHSHGITVSDSYTGGGSASIAEIPDHDHEGSLSSVWMPKINDKVVCLYLPIFSADGFILGTI